MVVKRLRQVMDAKVARFRVN